jgi:hypothetical protein
LASVYQLERLLAKVLADAKVHWQYPLPTRTRAGQHRYRIVVSTRDGVTLYQSELTPITFGFAPPRLLPAPGPWPPGARAGARLV